MADDPDDDEMVDEDPGLSTDPLVDADLPRVPYGAPQGDPVSPVPQEAWFCYGICFTCFSTFPIPDLPDEELAQRGAEGLCPYAKSHPIFRKTYEECKANDRRRK
jgi:hypothetical protein